MKQIGIIISTRPRTRRVKKFDLSETASYLEMLRSHGLDDIPSEIWDGSTEWDEWMINGAGAILVEPMQRGAVDILRNINIEGYSGLASELAFLETVRRFEEGFKTQIRQRGPEYLRNCIEDLEEPLRSFIGRCLVKRTSYLP